MKTASIGRSLFKLLLVLPLGCSASSAAPNGAGGTPVTAAGGAGGGTPSAGKGGSGLSGSGGSISGSGGGSSGSGSGGGSSGSSSSGGSSGSSSSGGSGSSGSGGSGSSGSGSGGGSSAGKGGSGGGGSAAGKGGNGAAGSANADALVVHEWGTYTSVQASDGHALGGVHHVDEALPLWVHQRNFDNPQSYFFESLPEEPRQQLETPVLYFHSPKKQDVTVTVDFPEGVVGEWYPEATSFTPAIGAMTGVGPGSMTWNLTMDPSIKPSELISVSADEIWAPSRNVATTPVRFANPATGQSEVEQFLFYRGLGKFVPPVRVVSGTDKALHIVNDSPDGVGSVFILIATETGGAFVSLGDLGGKAELVTPVPNPGLSVDAFVAAARAGLLGALVGTGLYADEAQAMVDTWTRSWFKNLGLRVLYVAPRKWTDQWLPTKVTPAPSSFVRTLVGRIEVLTAAEEADLVKQAQSASDAGTPIPLAPLGRFAEPRLERVAELLTDPKAKALAEATRKQVHDSPLRWDHAGSASDRRRSKRHPRSLPLPRKTAPGGLVRCLR